MSMRPTDSTSGRGTLGSHLRSVVSKVRERSQEGDLRPQTARTTPNADDTGGARSISETDVAGMSTNISNSRRPGVRGGNHGAPRDML